MPNMAEKVTQEVTSAKQEVESYLGDGAPYSETDKNLNPLSCIISLPMPNTAQKDTHKITATKQEVESCYTISSK